VIDGLIDFLDGPGALILVLLIVVGLFYLAFKEEQGWEAFVDHHHCRVIRETAGQTIVTSDGKTGYVSGTKTWACDDGKEYTR